MTARHEQANAMATTETGSEFSLLRQRTDLHRSRDRLLRDVERAEEENRRLLRRIEAIMYERDAALAGAAEMSSIASRTRERAQAVSSERAVLRDEVHKLREGNATLKEGMRDMRVESERMVENIEGAESAAVDLEAAVVGLEAERDDLRDSLSNWKQRRGSMSSVMSYSSRCSHDLKCEDPSIYKGTDFQHDRRVTFGTTIAPQKAQLCPSSLKQLQRHKSVSGEAWPVQLARMTGITRVIRHASERAIRKNQMMITSL
eukprot:CAMPEP_0183301884 /NCGR_PEP_ID=MMETSP0160_2-20130417/7862_1 /TAXON_ID=2839 ORGANISM="Odontella Sinensis, Strain Grunow 1884" /NCGR_SAMPLE_ID=MMETSP0160_2 /ASSEMBLY_ACC=CAM_ASM_000250 /LENGTH=259 /DNA_ID=CAMNT_0025464583 /DNA_START=70 /DNA_END=849 /DNA_ORIENTATION=-